MENVQKVINSLDLFSDRKITSEGRFNTLAFMKDYANVAVSFQMENPLNYIYFDLAWMGHPIIHNAHMCQDVGYYYAQFDFYTGGKLLNKVIKNHDFESYIKHNRLAISKYLPDNKTLQNFIYFKDAIDYIYSIKSGK